MMTDTQKELEFESIKIGLASPDVTAENIKESVIRAGCATSAGLR